jgi:hypothetical protein
LAAQIDAAECTHLVGDFWRVWPIALRVNVSRYESGGGRLPLWPVSRGSEAARPLWAPKGLAPEASICTLSGDNGWREIADRYGFPELPLVKQESEFAIRRVAASRTGRAGAAPSVAGDG